MVQIYFFLQYFYPQTQYLFSVASWGIYKNLFQCHDLLHHCKSILSKILQWMGYSEWKKRLEYCQAPGPGQVRSRSRSRSCLGQGPGHGSRLKQTQNWSFRVKNRDLERHYNQWSNVPPTHRHPPENFSKLKISSFQSYPPGSGPGQVPNWLRRVGGTTPWQPPPPPSKKTPQHT